MLYVTCTAVHHEMCSFWLLEWLSFLFLAIHFVLFGSETLDGLLCHHNRLAMHEESSTRRKVDDNVHEGALPAYLLDRETTARAKACFLSPGIHVLACPTLIAIEG